MTPYFSYEAPSAFGTRGPARIGVLVTYPAANEWYVIMDKKTATPFFETDSHDEAKKVADRFAAVSDLAYLATALENEDSIRYVESLLPIATSNDGLPLIPENMVESAASITFDESLDRAADGNEHWNTWMNRRDSVLAHRPRTLVFGFDVQEAVKDESGVVLETRQVLVLAEMKWGISDLKRIDLKVLDGNYEINGKPLHKLLHEIEVSPENEIWVESPEELEDWIGITERMPLFNACHKPEQVTRMYAYEGGPVLKRIAATRPWMVEKDDQGNPVPLRIVQAPLYDAFGEKGLKEDQHLIAAIFLMDEMTASVRAKIINEQRQQGIEPGQATESGQFVKVAELGAGVTLEAMFDRSTPNIIGTRDWVNYRLWVEGELVLDVHPGNPALYARRSVSISPLRGSLDRLDFSMTSEQVGDLLATALSEPDDEDKEGLPKRVIEFLQSSRCEELSGDAHDLESGTARIENGQLVLQEDSQGDDSLEP